MIFKLERVGELVLLILLNLLLLLRVVHNFLIFRGFVNIIMSLLRRISIERNYPNLTLLNLILILLWLSRLACKKVIILIILIFCAKWLKLSIQELIRILTFLCYLNLSPIWGLGINIALVHLNIWQVNWLFLAISCTLRTLIKILGDHLV